MLSFVNQNRPHAILFRSVDSKRNVSCIVQSFWQSWTWIFLLVRIVWVSNIYMHTSPSRASLIGMLIRLRTGRSGVESRHRQAIFLFSRISRPAGACSYSPLTSTEFASALPGVERETLYWTWYLFITPVSCFFFCVCIWVLFVISRCVYCITCVHYFIWKVWVATSFRLMECILCI